MKPNFALDLSHTGIRLLHLTKEGEPVLGQVALDDPDFDRHIADLRDQAQAQIKGQMRCLLLIPESEVLYTSVDAPGPDRDSRAAAVRQGLEGMTPYDLDDLVYDWRPSDGQALVAAVARDTLSEAEQFAVSYGFNPVRFSTRPKPGTFRGNPNFGQTWTALARQEGTPAPFAAPAARPEPAAGEVTEPAVTEQEIPADAPAPQEGQPSEASPTDKPASSPVAAGAPPGPGVDEPPADGAETPAPVPGKGPGAGGTAPLDPPSPDEEEADPAAPGGDGDTAPVPGGTGRDSENAPDDGGVDDQPLSDEGEPDAHATNDVPPVADLPDDADDDPALRPWHMSGPEEATAPTAEAIATRQDRTADDAPGAIDDSGMEGKDPTPVPPLVQQHLDRLARESGDAPTDGSDNGEAATAGPEADTEEVPAPRRRSAPVIHRRPAAPLEAGPAEEVLSLEDPEPEDDEGLQDPHDIGGPASTASPDLSPADPDQLSDAEAGPEVETDRALSFTSRRKPLADPAQAADPTLDQEPEDDPEARPDAAAVPSLNGPGAIAARSASIPEGGPPIDTAPPSAVPGADQPTGATPDAATRPGAPAASAGHLSPGPALRRGAPGPAVAGAAALGAGAATSTTPGGAGDLPDSGPAEASLAPVTTPRAKGAKGPRAGAITATRAKNETQAMTVFGERARVADDARGRSPLVIAIAIALIAAIGIWAAYLVLGPGRGEDVAQPDEAEVGLALPRDSAQGTPSSATGPDGTIAGTGPDAMVPADETSVGIDSPTVPLGETTAEAPEPILPEASEAGRIAAATPQLGAPLGGAADALTDGTAATSGDVTPDKAAARYAATGIWPLSPEAPQDPQGDRLESLYLASTDPTVAFAPEAAVPALPDSDVPTAPTSPPPPAPAGVEIELGPDGRVVATPEGAISPDGIRVTAGAPPVSPPDMPARPIGGPPIPETLRPDASTPTVRPRQRPETLTEAAAPAAEQDTETETAAAPDPAPRPEDVAEAEGAAEATDADADTAAGASTDETETAEGPEDTAPVVDLPASALVDRTPQPRPNDLAAEAVAAAVAASGASLAAQALDGAADPAASTADPAATTGEQVASLEEPAEISPFALDRSPVPAARPARVEQRAAAVAAAPAASPAQAPVAAPAAASVVQPRNPTSASVASSATTDGAINLRRLNLVGVFGGGANRRALLRLPSGRFVKVKVGDSIDGGRIASIGESDLRYVKSGRNFTLSMPNG
ncbi:hypothetical protein EKE94_03770 [Mesobaculum littorinae]|uniref:Type IV pilus biogenesis n=1 Tax=Mesobaculum littorinae TaxID=2486419 RepID=A0A438AM94_9RHOB|nr:hypothetical protein [Mesobaculum littorinae]RVV99802.1 hypothetical protein EKE94_03770 [Mesobaculum littorinae]